MQPTLHHPLLRFIQTHLVHFPVNPQGLAEIVSHFEEETLAKNEFLLKQGRVSQYYFLAEGFARAFTFDADGHEITTGFYSGGRVVFEVASFFLRSPSTENIQCLTDCRVYSTTFEKLNTLFHSMPEFREFGRAILVREFVAHKQHTLSMINKRAEERYIHLLATHREIFQHAQLRHIASYLGITDTSLSRIRKEISRQQQPTGS